MLYLRAHSATAGTEVQSASTMTSHQTAVGTVNMAINEGSQHLPECLLRSTAAPGPSVPQVTQHACND